jgi:hypothetical protein
VEIIIPITGCSSIPLPPRHTVRKDALGKLDSLLKKSSAQDIGAELNKPHNKSIRKEFLEALNISKGTQHLELIQTLEKRYNRSGSMLTESVISSPEDFVRLLVDNG